jgi:hypothetical protein
MVGVYSNPPVTAIQIGSKAANSIDLWTWGGTTMISAAGLFTPTNNTWIHVAYTFDGTTHRLYINGTFITSSTTTQIAGTLGTMYVNGYPTGGVSETSAVMTDDTILFNRLLGADEINTIYNCAGAVDGISYGVAARYKYDEGAAGSNIVSVLDYSGNGNTLTPSGAGTPMTYVSTYIAHDTSPVLG